MDISQLSLKRLFQRAGIKRISNTSYEKLYLQINELISNIIEKSVTLINTRQNNVLNNDDIQKGFFLTNLLNIIETTVQSGGEYKGYCDNEASQCADVFQQKGGISFCDGEVSQCGDYSKDLSSSCSNVGKQNGGGDYFFSIPSTQFSRLIKNMLLIHKNQKITKSAVNHLQYLVETTIVSSLINKNKDNSRVFNLD
jgi:histone H3/H4